MNHAQNLSALRQCSLDAGTKAKVIPNIRTKVHWAILGGGEDFLCVVCSYESTWLTREQMLADPKNYKIPIEDLPSDLYNDMLALRTRKENIKRAKEILNNVSRDLRPEVLEIGSFALEAPLRVAAKLYAKAKYSKFQSDVMVSAKRIIRHLGIPSDETVYMNLFFPTK